MRTSRWRKWAVAAAAALRFFGRFRIRSIGFDGRIQAQGQDQDGTGSIRELAKRKTFPEESKSRSSSRRRTCEKHARCWGTPLARQACQDAVKEWKFVPAPEERHAGC